MVAVALACLPVFVTGREIARWEGGVFLGYYVAYAIAYFLAERSAPRVREAARRSWPRRPKSRP